MRIGFDLNPLITHCYRGIGQTTSDMARGLLAAVSNANGAHELVLYVDEAYLGAMRAAGHHLMAPVVPVAHPAELPAQVRRDGLDVMHLNDYFFPLYRAQDVCSRAFLPARSVLVVRDIFPILFPDQNAAGCERLEANLLPLLDRVDQVIAISAWTRNQVAGHLGIAADRIEVIHHGVDTERFRPRSGAVLANLLEQYRLTRPFILYAAALDRRKNHGVLVEAFVRFVREVPEAWDLVLVGPGTPRSDLLHTASRSGLEGHVHFLGWVPPQELPLFYAAATIFAFPSLYEGFGNPVLEAMASGVPVIAARAASVPEVAEDAALLVDPLDIDAWADALFQLATRPELRALLRDKGLARARLFSWETAASRLLVCYQKVLERPRVLDGPQDEGGMAW